MPFKSEKQRRWMWANEPEMAKRWEDEIDEKWEGGDNLEKPIDHAEIASGHKPHQGLEILSIAESHLRKLIRKELIIELTMSDEADEALVTPVS